MSGSPFPDDSIVKAERYVRSTAAQKIPFFVGTKQKNAFCQERAFTLGPS
jgi:hypothetical protein